jgi:hypothetical protein
MNAPDAPNALKAPTAPGSPNSPSAPNSAVAELGAARPELAELAPAVRRAVALDPSIPVRLRRGGGRSSAVLRLPFGVLAARSLRVAREDGAPDSRLDVTVDGGDLLAWLDGTRPAAPEPRDERWRGTLPPEAGWRRLDTVPADVVREIVRTGALAASGQPRRSTDALLDASALRVSDEHGHSVAVSLRTLSALIRLGFAPAGTSVAVDLCGRWARVAGLYGSVYAERPEAALTLAG